MANLVPTRLYIRKCNRQRPLTVASPPRSLRQRPRRRGVSPGPSARCIRTRVEPAAVLEADASIRPDQAKAERCGAGRRRPDAPLPPPMTAIICRKPAPRIRAISAVKQGPADAAALRGRREVDRILDRGAVGGAGPVGPGIGVAEHRARRARPRDRESRPRPARIAPPRHLGRPGGSSSKEAVP